MKNFGKALAVAGLMVAGSMPAHALDLEALLNAARGIGKIEDLAVPLLVGLVGLIALLFWVVSRLGKRRMRRQIGLYDQQLAEHSRALRRAIERRRR